MTHYVTFPILAEQYSSYKRTATYLLLPFEKIDVSKFVVVEVSFRKSQTNTHRVRGGMTAVKDEGWHLCGV